MKIDRTTIRRHKQGSAVIAMLVILAIMFTLFTINSNTLKRLSQHVDAMNRQQTNRLTNVTK
jgi:Na+/melibiose symporter-like transporter